MNDFEHGSTLEPEYVSLQTDGWQRVYWSTNEFGSSEKHFIWIWTEDEGWDHCDQCVSAPLVAHTLHWRAFEWSVGARAILHWHRPLTDILPKALKDKMVPRVTVFHEGLEGIWKPVIVTKNAPDRLTSMSDVFWWTHRSRRNESDLVCYPATSVGGWIAGHSIF